MYCCALGLKKKGRQKKKRFISHIKAGISHPRDSRLVTKELVRPAKEMNEGWVLGCMNVFGLDRQIGYNLNVYRLGTLYSYRYFIYLFFLIIIMKVTAWMCGFISADSVMYYLKQWFSHLKQSLPRMGRMSSLATGDTCYNNRKAFSGCSVSVLYFYQIEFPLI